MDTLSRFWFPGTGFLFTLIFGFWLSRVGKPYNNILFNIHKLIALGTVVFAGMRMYEVFKFVELQTTIMILTVIAVISVVALFASGAFMSIGNVNHNMMKTIHNVAPMLFIVAVGSVFYLLS